MITLLRWLLAPRVAFYDRREGIAYSIRAESELARSGVMLR